MCATGLSLLCLGSTDFRLLCSMKVLNRPASLFYFVSFTVWGNGLSIVKTRGDNKVEGNVPGGSFYKTSVKNPTMTTYCKWSAVVPLGPLYAVWLEELLSQKKKSQSKHTLQHQFFRRGGHKGQGKHWQRFNKPPPSSQATRLLSTGNIFHGKGSATL